MSGIWNVRTNGALFQHARRRWASGWLRGNIGRVRQVHRSPANSQAVDINAANTTKYMNTSIEVKDGQVWTKRKGGRAPRYFVVTREDAGIVQCHNLENGREKMFTVNKLVSPQSKNRLIGSVEEIMTIADQLLSPRNEPMLDFWVPPTK